MAKDPSLDSLDQLLNKRMTAFRSERYEPGNPEQMKWLTRAVNSVFGELSAEERELLVKDLVLSRARTLESDATKSTNSLLRDAGKTGQFPLDWFDDAHLPISFERIDVDDDGKETKTRLRVKLGYATADDFRAWIATEKRRLDRATSASDNAVKGCLVMIDALDQLNVPYLMQTKDEDVA